MYYKIQERIKKQIDNIMSSIINDIIKRLLMCSELTVKVHCVFRKEESSLNLWFVIKVIVIKLFKEVIVITVVNFAFTLRKKKERLVFMRDG